MSGPIVVGEPTGEVVSLLARLNEEGVPTGTLVWRDHDALRSASDDIAAYGWDVLVVVPQDEALSGAAMGHRSQIHGSVCPVVVHSERDGDATAVAIAVLRHMPGVPVVVCGPAANEVDISLTEVTEEMGLDVHLAPDLEAMSRLLWSLYFSPTLPTHGN